MAKHYVSEQGLKDIFDSQYSCDTWEEFYEWVETKIQEQEIERVEIDTYEVSKLDYKPDVKLTGENGNIFNLMSIVSRVLREVGKEERAKEMCERITRDAKDYQEALLIIWDYVEVK